MWEFLACNFFHSRDTNTVCVVYAYKHSGKMSKSSTYHKCNNFIWYSIRRANSKTFAKNGISNHLTKFRLYFLKQTKIESYHNQHYYTRGFSRTRQPTLKKKTVVDATAMADHEFYKIGLFELEIGRKGKTATGDSKNVIATDTGKVEALLSAKKVSSTKDKEQSAPPSKKRSAKPQPPPSTRPRRSHASTPVSPTSLSSHRARPPSKGSSKRSDGSSRRDEKSAQEKSLSEQIYKLDNASERSDDEQRVRKTEGPLDPLVKKFLYKVKKETLSNSLSGVKFLEAEFVEESGEVDYTPDQVFESMMNQSIGLETELLKLLIELDTIYDFTVYLNLLERIAIYDCTESTEGEMPGLPTFCSTTLQVMKKMSAHVVENLLKAGAAALATDGSESKILALDANDVAITKCNVQ